MEEEIFKVNGYELDDEQKEVVLSNGKNILVIAGAGSGKSLTIIGKIKYLINKQLVNKEEILCISFTNDSCNSLRQNLKKNNLEIEVLTFHKLGMKILKSNKQSVNISNEDILEIIIDSFFHNTIYEQPKYMIYLLKYKKIKYNKKTYIKKYEEEINKKEMYILKQTIKKFISIYKSNGYSYEFLSTIIKKYNNLFSKKYIYLIIIITKIFLEYENKLKEENIMDFDDIILKATNLVKDTNLKYKYIIIDEFQDTSMVRYKLVSEILNKTNAYFLAVGDDYQSIYRFTGCDIYLFINFKKYFKETKIYKIQTTYRNSQELINVAGAFIKKNKYQIDKNLRSNKKLNKPIKIVEYKNQKMVLMKLLDYLYQQNKKEIMILIRNNKDINNIISENIKIIDNKIIYKNHEEMNIVYFTVHKSKGLEGETVIILSLVDDILGFPNKIKEEKILKYILPKKEKYKYAEERRLFYVALTRTKNEVFLMVSKNNPSKFILEIIKQYSIHIENVVL